MKKYFVIGNPIDHSLSPKLHNFWINNNNLDAYYDRKKLEVNQIEKFILDCKSNKVAGINVTVPFKKTVIPYLDKLSFEAEKTQSVNTIILKDGYLTGYNTDIIGFQTAIEKLNFNIKKKKIFILGAGGVVPSLIFALEKMNVLEIKLTNRTIERAKNLKTQFNNLEIVEWGKVPDFDVIINATSLGLKNEDINLDFSKVGQNKLFYDVIYNPQETNFLKVGKETGNIAENGILMFVYQALEAFNMWHGIKPEINNETIEILNND
tara:strand:- start:2224 stop:3018 length:795 start_codon:yes stop_codon:yes gene_type:complete